MNKSIFNSQFVKLLRSLKDDELKDFDKLLKTSNGVEYKVLNFILGYKPDFKNDNLNKEQAFKRIFKKEKFNYSKITNALSRLKKSLEEFLIQQELNNQVFTRNYLLIQNLERRDADDFFYKEIKDAQEELDKKDKIDAWHYLKNLQLNHIKYYKANAVHMKAENQLIEKTMKSLDEFFVASKLKYACELFNIVNISQESPLVDILEPQNIQITENENFTFFKVYELALKLTAHGNIQLYNTAKNQMLQNSQFLTKYDLQIINGYLLNFVNVEIKKGNKEFVKEAFLLFEFAERNDILVIDGHLSTMRFFNIINIASSLKETAWSRDFIDKWGKYLDVHDKKEVIKIGKATILFEEKEYSMVIDLISNVKKFDNILNEIRGRSLEMRSFYEMKDNSMDELLISKCNSLNNQLRRNRTLSENAKKPIFTFIKIFRKLLNDNLSYDDLINVLNENSSVICKNWLKSKIDELR